MSQQNDYVTITGAELFRHFKHCILKIQIAINSKIVYNYSYVAQKSLNQDH